MKREKAIDFLVSNGIFTEDECRKTNAGIFYVNNLMCNHDIYDVDRYAWLNTLFQYDIGYNIAMEIDSWLWGSKSVLREFPLGFDTLELEWNDQESKRLLMECNTEKKLNLDFSNWLNHDVDCYQYFN